VSAPPPLCRPDCPPAVWVDDTDFAHWHYRRDPTHVVFYRQANLLRLAARFDWECDVPRVDVAFLAMH
jgi:hypothetical protein